MTGFFVRKGKHSNRNPRADTNLVSSIESEKTCHSSGSSQRRLVVAKEGLVLLKMRKARHFFS